MFVLVALVGREENVNRQHCLLMIRIANDGRQGMYDMGPGQINNVARTRHLELLSLTTATLFATQQCGDSSLWW